MATIRISNHAMIDGDDRAAATNMAAGAEGDSKLPSAIGRSRGGLTTKIVALVDALGNLARFILLPGQPGTIASASIMLYSKSGSSP